MAITRRLIAQDTSQDAQWLKIDHSTRYIENHSDEWQFIFGPNSELDNSSQIVKIAAKFDDTTFNNIKIIAYLYDQKTSSVANASSCIFSLSKVSGNEWVDENLTTINGTQLNNSYYYIHPELSIFSGLDFLGGDTIVIEATVLRLGVTYRDKLYVNHLGIYDNVTRLRQDVEFLEITKKDL